MCSDLHQWNHNWTWPSWWYSQDETVLPALHECWTCHNYTPWLIHHQFGTADARIAQTKVPPPRSLMTLPWLRWLRLTRRNLKESRSWHRRLRVRVYPFWTQKPWLTMSIHLRRGHPVSNTVLALSVPNVHLTLQSFLSHPLQWASPQRQRELLIPRTKTTAPWNTLSSCFVSNYINGGKSGWLWWWGHAWIIDDPRRPYYDTGNNWFWKILPRS
jgi:hypothetical protein